MPLESGQEVVTPDGEQVVDELGRLRTVSAVEAAAATPIPCDDCTNCRACARLCNGGAPRFFKLTFSGISFGARATSAWEEWASNLFGVSLKGEFCAPIQGVSHDFCTWVCSWWVPVPTSDGTTSAAAALVLNLHITEDRVFVSLSAMVSVTSTIFSGGGASVTHFYTFFSGSIERSDDSCDEFTIPNAYQVETATPFSTWLIPGFGGSVAIEPAAADCEHICTNVRFCGNCPCPCASAYCITFVFLIEGEFVVLAGSARKTVTGLWDFRITNLDESVVLIGSVRCVGTEWRITWADVSEDATLGTGEFTGNALNGCPEEIVFRLLGATGGTFNDVIVTTSPKLDGDDCNADCPGSCDPECPQYLDVVYNFNGEVVSACYELGENCRWFASGFGGPVGVIQCGKTSLSLSTEPQWLNTVFWNDAWWRLTAPLGTPQCPNSEPWVFRQTTNTSGATASIVSVTPRATPCFGSLCEGVTAFSTGVGTWTINDGDSYIVAGQDPPDDVYPLNPDGPWVAASDGAAWIGIHPNDEDSAGPTNREYETTISIDDMTALTGLTINGRYAADDQLTDILVNGVSTGRDIGGGFMGYTAFTLTEADGLIVGDNTITFVVSNTGAGPGVGDFTGLIAVFDNC